MKQALMKALSAAGMKLTGVAGWLISLIGPMVIDAVKGAILGWIAKRRAEKAKKQVDEAQAKYEQAAGVEDDEARKRARAEALCSADPNCPRD